MIYYKESIETLYKHFNTSSSGLTQDEADRLLKINGYNELNTEIKINKLSLFISQFKSFIIYILLFAVLLSFLTGEYIDAAIILIILLINALIGFFQELSAQKSLAALKKFNRINAMVWRDNKLTEKDAKYLVPGDIISVSAGDKVPADCRVIEANGLKVQESVLTGESMAVNKFPDIIKTDSQLGDQNNMLFSSTSITDGLGTALVVGTGMATEIGQIAELIRDTKEEITPLQKKLDLFGKNLSLTIVVVCLFIFTMIAVEEYLSMGFSVKAFREIALISVALAVAAVPEGLPAVVTITLSIGVKKLLKKRIIVKRLASVETLGSCDVICTDKTGTLTRNEMRVTHVWNLDGEALLSGVGYRPGGEVSNKLSPLIYEIGMICNRATVFENQGEWQITGDPTEAALMVSAMTTTTQPEFTQISLLPFDSSRKKMSVLIRRDDRYYVYTKGAPDPILENCTQVISNNQVMPLTAEIQTTIRAQINHYASQALRVIAFAYKTSSNDESIDEHELIFVGLQAMTDPPRDDVIQSIVKTKQAGIRVVMITGDYKETAIAIGKKIGITGLCLEGKDLQGMDEADLKQALSEGVNIFSRTIPADKQKIVAALQNLGSIVAMTGDGINDAPALKKADIGVAVGSGTDVAKEASDFILLDDSFTHIVNAIEEGRGIYDNIQKTIMLLLSGNLSEVLIVVMAVILGWDLPLTVIMILWINLVSDGAPALALSVDPYSENIMQRQPRVADAGILSGQLIYFVVFLALITTFCGLFMFKIYAQSDLVMAQTVVFNVIIVAEIGLLFAIRFLFQTPQATNIWLWLTVVVTLFVQLLIMYTPVADIFKVTALEATTLTWIMLVGLVVFLVGVLYVLINKTPKNKLHNE